MKHTKNNTPPTPKEAWLELLETLGVMRKESLDNRAVELSRMKFIVSGKDFIAYKRGNTEYAVTPQTLKNLVADCGLSDSDPMYEQIYALGVAYTMSMPEAATKSLSSTCVDKWESAKQYMQEDDVCAGYIQKLEVENAPDNPQPVVEHVESIEPELPSKLSAYIVQVANTRLYSNHGKGEQVIRADMHAKLDENSQRDYAEATDLTSANKLSLRVFSKEPKISHAIRAAFKEPESYLHPSLADVFEALKFTTPDDMEDGKLSETEIAEQVFQKELAARREKSKR